MTRAINSQPVGYFVHDQGRGHARRCAAILQHLPPERPVTVFTSSPDLLPALPKHVEIVRIPGLYDHPGGIPAGLDGLTGPESMHFVPLGWPNVREAMRTIAEWFHGSNPALFVVDVSAELTLLARLCSVPCVTLRQHGTRTDPTHAMAYDSCVGLIAPFDARLEQPDTPETVRAKTFYSGGLNPTTGTAVEPREPGIGTPGRRRIVVLSGGGGDGFPLAPLCDGARALPDSDWTVLGQVRKDGEDTLPDNLHCLGWVAYPPAYVAAADVVVASAGDSTVHEICELGRPYLCLPEWRHFREQDEKVAALAALNAAHRIEAWPEGPDAWRHAVAQAGRVDSAIQRSLVDPDAAGKIARYLEDMIARLWGAPVERQA